MSEYLTEKHIHTMSKWLVRDQSTYYRFCTFKYCNHFEEKEAK